MKYSKTTTINHPIVTKFPNCIEEINVLINNNIECFLHYCFHFDNNEVVINGDNVERTTATIDNNRLINKSVDLFIGISDKESIQNEIVLVELKLNYQNNLRNLKANDINDKVTKSCNLLGDTIEIHQNFIFIFSEHLIEQARNRFRRLFPIIPSNYLPITLVNFKERYFNL